MASATAVGSVPHTIRRLKRVDYQGKDWDTLREAGRRG